MEKADVIAGSFEDRVITGLKKFILAHIGEETNQSLGPDAMKAILYQDGEKRRLFFHLEALGVNPDYFPYACNDAINQVIGASKTLKGIMGNIGSYEHFSDLDPELQNPNFEIIARALNAMAKTQEAKIEIPGVDRAMA